MKNGRCRMHGGKSTGARTEDGLKRIRQANFKNGNYTKEMLEERRYFSELLKENKEFIKNSI
jgi:flagellar biosynthesis/type III secretory pathway chaperone